MSSTTLGTGVMPERRWVSSRPQTQSVFGIIAVVLGIVGLAIAKMHPDVPVYLDAIAAIALGLALIFVGTSLASAYGRLLSRATEADMVGGQITGTTVGMFAGGAIIILGILALLAVEAPVLIAIEAILIGTGLLWTAAASVRLSTVESEVTGDRSVARRVTEEVVFASASVSAMAGIAVAILGILAVVGFATVPLTLVAMLVAGTAMLVGGSSVGTRVTSALMPRT